LVFIFGFFLVYGEFNELETEVAQFREEQIKSRITLNKNAVSQAISFIEQKRLEEDEKLKKRLKEEGEQLYSVIDSLSKEHKLTKKEIADISEGFNKNNNIRLEIVIHKQDGINEGYYIDESFKTISFIKLYEPLDIYIIASKSLKLQEEEVKKTIIDTLRYIRFGKENSGYIFISEVYDLKGGREFAKEILLPIDPLKEGRLLSDEALDGKGRAYRKEYLRQIRETGEAIVTYAYKMTEGADKEREKISYLYYYKPWNWIIGTGVYMDYIDEYISSYEEDSIDRIKENIFVLVGLLVAFGIIAYILSMFFNKRLVDAFEGYQTKVDEKERMLKQYKYAITSSTIYSKTDKDGYITDVNDEMCRISGFSRDELIGSKHSLLRHPDEPDEKFRQLWLTINEKRVFKGVMKNRSKEGRDFYASSTIVPILDKEGEIEEFIAIRMDISDLVEQEKRIQRQITDRLTGLYNVERLKEDIRIENITKLAILKLNRVKDISNLYGNESADTLIKNSSVLIQELCGKKPLSLYRFGYDAFALGNSSYIENHEFIAHCEHIIDDFSNASLSINGAEFDISISAGITVTGEHLLEEAQAALEQAKRNRTVTAIYSEEMPILSEYKNNIEWTRSIKEAIYSDNIIPFAQAIYDIENNKIEKYESLIRLRKNGEIFSPYFFLEVAKRSNLYRLLTKTMIDKTFPFFAERDTEFSINISLEDINDKESCNYLFDKIAEFNIGKLLTLEIVESEGIERFDEVMKFIHKSKLNGCKIAIDDFGTGYSNFDYLLKLNADIIKIDGSLVKNVNINTHHRKLVSMIVDFAKNADMKVVAEFVHSKEVFDAVKALGVDYAQGYFIGTPKDLKEIG